MGYKAKQPQRGGKHGRGWLSGDDGWRLLGDSTLRQKFGVWERVKKKLGRGWKHDISHKIAIVPSQNPNASIRNKWE